MHGINNPVVMSRWTTLLALALVISGLGVKWAVLHGISIGSEIWLSKGDKDGPIITAIAKSFTDHSNCSVCDYLNEKRSEQDQKSTQKNVVIDIKAVTFSLGVVISSETIWADDLTGPSSINLEFIDSIIPPPPQSAV